MELLTFRVPIYAWPVTLYIHQMIQTRPKIKLSLFPQTRPTRENRPDSNNFFAIFFKELFFPDFRYNRYRFVVLR